MDSMDMDSPVNGGLTRALLGGGAFERPPPQVFRG